MKWLFAALQLIPEFMGVFTPQVKVCVERARLVRGLGPSWSVTYAADAGENVEIRFDQDPQGPNWQMLLVLVHKASGEITVTAKMTSSPAVYAN